MRNDTKEIWYISKYAGAPIYGYPSRQFFFSQYFSKYGRDVTMISSRSISKYEIPSFGVNNHFDYTDQNVKGVILNGSPIKLGFNLKRVFSWLVFEARLLYWALSTKKKKPDVIIVSSLSLLTFLTGAILKRIYNCKLICEVRDIWPLTVIETKGWSERNVFVKLLSLIERIGYKNADLIIGTMPNLKEHVEGINPTWVPKVSHIPMGYDPDFWNSESVSDEDNLINQFFNENIPSNHFTVGYAGSMGFVNCVDQIIKAAELLRDKPISFVLLGDGPLKKDLETMAQNLQLKNLYFLNPVPKKHVQIFLKNCDLLLNPWKGGNSIYKYGVSPNKWIDYMFSAKPILVSLDGFRSILDEAGCGEFIEADNFKKMATAIEQFSEIDKTKLKHMGEKGKEYLINNLSYSILSKKYLEIIDSLD